MWLRAAASNFNSVTLRKGQVIPRRRRHTLKPKSLNVPTWNVWFEEYEFQRRYDHILDITENLRPDVACFQEVTELFLETLQSRHGILKEYELSYPDLKGNTVSGYGVITLVKKIWQPTFKTYEFPTKMSRKFLLASLQTEEKIVQNSSFCVGNAHLESLNNHSVREEQLKVCTEVFKDYTNYVLVGDFNFCSYRNYQGRSGKLENDSLQNILPDIVDLWPALHNVTSEPGITFDGSLNPMIIHR